MKLGKRILNIIAYPLETEKRVGHLDILEEMFENQKSLFEEVYVYSSFDNGKDYELRKGIKVITSKIILPKPLNLLWDILYLYLKFRKNKPTIIRALVPHTTGIVALALSKLLGVPFVVSVHTDRKFVNKVEKNIPWFYEPFANFLEKKVYEESIIIPVISNYIGNYVNSFGEFRDKIFLHRNWVDLTLFKPKKMKKNYDLLFIGRVEKIKGVDMLIKIAEKMRNIRIGVIGEGKERERLEKEAKEKKINVEFLGRIEHKELPNYLNKSKIFISPFAGGFTFIEALACGVPIITYENEWANEVVLEGKTGFLVKKYHVNEFVKVIGKALKDEKKLEEMGREGRKFVEKHFSLESWKKREKKIYEKVIKEFKK